MTKYRRSVTWADVVKRNNKARATSKLQIEETIKKIEKIKKHIQTEVIRYPEFKECYDYVFRLFPRVNIKKVVAFQASARYLSRVGYAGIGGFYDRLNKNVVFASGSLSGARENKRNKWAVVAKIEKDETLVHEFIHYSYFEDNYGMTVDQQEEFAYGWSSGYLKNKGYSNDEIVNNNFLPYLYQVATEVITTDVFTENGITAKNYNSSGKLEKRRIFKKYGQEIHDRSLEVARKRGHQIIEIYSKKIAKVMKIEPSDVGEKKSRFSLMDF